jgi:hypothetical protein
VAAVFPIVGAQVSTPVFHKEEGVMSRSSVLYCLAVVCVVFTLGANAGRPTARAPGQSPYILRTSVFGVAGGVAAGGDRVQRGTLGQPTPIGVSAAAGRAHFAGFWATWSGTVWTGVEEEAPIFSNELYQNYPNPFNPTTTIRYSVASAGEVVIDILDVLGHRVKTLVRDTRAPGIYTITWDGSDDSGNRVASGVYFCRFNVSGYQTTKKVAVLK